MLDDLRRLGRTIAFWRRQPLPRMTMAQAQQYQNRIMSERLHELSAASRGPASQGAGARPTGLDGGASTGLDRPKAPDPGGDGYVR